MSEKGILAVAGILISIFPIIILIMKLFRPYENNLKNGRAISARITVALLIVFAYYMCLGLFYHWIDKWMHIDAFVGAIFGFTALIAGYLFFLAATVMALLQISYWIKRKFCLSEKPNK